MSKSDLLPTNLVGDNHVRVQVEDDQFRVYYQGKDYKLCEMQRNSPDKAQYNLLKLSDFTPAARIAASVWNGLREVRKFDANLYASFDVVQEIVYNTQDSSFQGATLGTAVENSSYLYAQVRANLPLALFRVGFQSAEAPQTIIEAYFFATKEGWNFWKTSVF
ncbi:hypothetical protein K503DRAFT_800918 [Rhizopogon vinicolor AM-OR11-026]|uniref:Uncharacterized protein n=1 Tax=Rhizopogon vinicolor AM-OR11-026 TaxID=1314800 RepID=A0A1B7MYZ2_9AGAM|nr:hypothetical protein K503DRAFT_800918 [Rhizopogon vinicolor AM-OR11-026]